MILRLGKIGRYHSVCEFLLAAARRKIFKNIKVEITQIQSPTTTTISPPVPSSTLQEILARVLPQAAPIEQTLISFLKARSCCSFKAEESAFLTMMDDKCRIHAEMRLLFYYELNSVEIRPRVISSSKSACFLCDLFIKIHERFYTPRTHGVLYHQWRLPGEAIIATLPVPRQQKLAAILQRFNAAIENVIRSKVNSRRMVRLHPNESVLLHTSNWSTSEISWRSQLADEAKGVSTESRESAQWAVDGVEDSPQTSKDTENTDTDRRQSTLTDPLDIESIHGVTALTTYPPNVATLPSELTSPSPDIPNKQPTVNPKQPLAPSIITETSSTGALEGHGDGQRNPTIAGEPVIVIVPDIPKKASEPPPLALELSPKPLVTRRVLLSISPTTSNLSPLDVSSSTKLPLVSPLDKVNIIPGTSEVLIDPSITSTSPTRNPSLYTTLSRSETLSVLLPIRLSTKHIRLSLSSASFPQAFTASSNPIMVNVTWLARDAHPADGAQVIDIDNLRIGLDRVLQDGAACSEKDLWLARRSDVVGIKYIVADVETMLENKMEARGKG